MAVKGPQPKQNVQMASKSSIRNRKRRERKRNQQQQTATRLVSVPANVGSISETTNLSRPGNALKQLMKTPGLQVSQDGMSFLKCAFAPPDFQAERVAGVPDRYAGRTLIKKHRLVQSFKFSNNTDWYILAAPTPGVAFWYLQKAAGTPVLDVDVFKPVYYSDFTSLFGPHTGDQAADVVDKFRYISNCAEIICTSNAMTWSGSIQAFKLPLCLTERRTGVFPSETIKMTITGLQSLNQTNADQSTFSFNMGAFCMATKNSADFEFKNIIETYPNMPPVISPGVDFCQLDGTFMGLGDMDTICFKISGLTGDNTAIIKTWACVEYSPIVGSIVYEYAKGSPEHDPMALELYNHIAMNLPVAVSAFENAGLWEKILNIIRGVTRLGAFVPGPVGVGFTGAGLIAEALSELTL